MKPFHPIDYLSQIEKGEAPEHLFDKIQTRIDKQKVENFSIGASYAIAASMALFLGLNISLIVFKENKTNKMNLFTQLNTNNDLYK
jgi:hypothetical protein